MELDCLKKARVGYNQWSWYFKYCLWQCGQGTAWKPLDMMVFICLYSPCQIQIIYPLWHKNY